MYRKQWHALQFLDCTSFVQPDKALDLFCHANEQGLFDMLAI